MREILSDIVKHIAGLGFINEIKLTGTEDKTSIEGIDANKTVIVKGQLKIPSQDFIGDFGMGQLGLLKGLVEFPIFKDEKTSLKIVKRERNEKLVPEEIVFSNKQTATYRFMSPELIPDQVKFLGTSVDVKVTPSKSAINLFSSMAGLYASFEQFFLPKTVDGELRFYIGDENSASHKAFVVFDQTDGVLNTNLYYPIAQVLSILKLAEDGKVTMGFSQKGALIIDIETDIAEWKYILPARKK